MRFQRQAVLLAVLLVVTVMGCTDHEAREAAEANLTKVSAELATTKADLAKVSSELKTARAALEEAQEEVKTLKLTARFFFDEATSKMAASKSDDGDEVAIKAFQVVVDRYPDDVLAKSASDRISELKGRIDDRAKKLATAQAEVRKLIKQCGTNMKAGRAARDGALRFNAFNDIDMNSAMAGARRGDALEAKAKKAKDDATELLKTVPDPGGELAKMLEKCNEAE